MSLRKDLENTKSASAAYLPVLNLQGPKPNQSSQFPPHSPERLPVPVPTGPQEPRKSPIYGLLRPTRNDRAWFAALVLESPEGKIGPQ